MRPTTRRGTSPLAVGLLCVLLTAAGCARSWPDAVPDPQGWQIRTAPMLELADSQGNITRGGEIISAFVYASNWNERPRGLDDPTIRTVMLPSRLDIVCRDRDADNRGSIDIHVIPSATILRRWHPQNWKSAQLVLAGGDQPAAVIPVTPTPAIDGIAPYISGEADTADALAEFKRRSSAPDGTASLTATFIDDDRPPLTIAFPIGVQAGGHRLRLLYEWCGETW